MKKIISLLIACVLVFSAFSVYGAEEVAVFVNGNQVVSEVPAVVVNGSTMLPFRAIFNALGVKDEEITWEGDSKSIFVSSGGNFIFLVIGSPGAVINDNMIYLNTAPYIENGRTLVPVRFVSEALGAQVDWNGDTKTVTITK